MARRSLKPQLNQIRTWVRQGRTDAWIAHQLQVTVRDIVSFKKDHDLAPADSDSENGAPAAFDDDLDLRAEDDAFVAAELDAEPEEEDEPEDSGSDPDSGGSGAGEDDDDDPDKPKRRRRGRRGGRGRGRGGRGGKGKPLEGTFDHGEEGFGLWLDPAVQDNPLYAEHWAGQREIVVRIETDRIVIERPGGPDEDSEDGGDAPED
ncbi:MAG: hypothetical protein H0V29_09195 [Thermoleophilaceae bacterium]|nr:hypothetical protein [Thermoleophilaceae bacterium]